MKKKRKNILKIGIFKKKRLAEKEKRKKTN